MSDMHRWMAEDEARRDDAANAKKAAVAPDGSNPLARIDVGANNDGTAYAICDCLVELQSRMYSINLQDLVTAAHAHANVCILHIANLAAIEKENRP